MRRRECVRLFGGGAATWPLVARAQQPKRGSRIGVLMSRAANDPDGRTVLGAFVQGLLEANWVDGRNVTIDTRWAAGDAALIRNCAGDLVALNPDTIGAGPAPAVTALQRASRTVQI